MNDCGLVAQIYLDEKLSLKSFLSDCWICGKKNSNGCKESKRFINIVFISSTKGYIKNPSRESSLKKTRVKKPLKKRKWMGRKGGGKKWSISNFGLVSENIYLGSSYLEPGGKWSSEYAFWLQKHVQDIS